MVVFGWGSFWVKFGGSLVRIVVVVAVVKV